MPLVWSTTLRPSRIHRRAHIETELDTPSGADEAITGALAQVKAERETDLEKKAIAAMEPVDGKTLPLLGIAAGVRF
ncbi:hypothetical protein E3A20_10750 [Planctomyces bekefii]|uniref:Uncharacterized protein n=1 Tax=Planctomyces bekefii TaxID=1653850 RepID=A0A5C6M6K4_9PLAN|nr:hypothetical protein E3A20_10750 [Planctomyces bekefii]